MHPSLPNCMGQPVSVGHKLFSFPCQGTATRWLLGIVHVSPQSFRKVPVVMSQEGVKEQCNSRGDLGTSVWEYTLALFTDVISPCGLVSD